MTALPAAAGAAGREPARDLGIVWAMDWRLRLYAVGGRAPREELVEAARVTAARVLPAPAIAPGRDGTAYAVLCDDDDGECLVTVAWWTGRGDLHQWRFRAPAGAPRRLAVDRTSRVATAAELAVLEGERRAWLEHAA